MSLLALGGWPASAKLFQPMINITLHSLPELTLVLHGIHAAPQFFA
jgi:hypothetical protein